MPTEAQQKKLDRLVRAMERVEGLRPLAENRDVQAYFDALADKLLEDMLELPPADHNGRAHHAFLIKTVRALRGFIQSATDAGHRAEREYAKLIDHIDREGTTI